MWSNFTLFHQVKPIEKNIEKRQILIISRNLKKGECSS